MQAWINYGVRLAWLIDPYTERVHIYQAGLPVTLLKGFEGRQLSGEPELKGFVLDLGQMKRIQVDLTGL
jgi:Uma2 family endonuclease